MIRDIDIFGRMLMAHLRGRDAGHFIERSDGQLNAFPGRKYFELETNPAVLRAKRMVRGRVLDIGCGAGRHALLFQRHGLKVTGIDASPLAIKVCRARGVKNARVMGVDHLGRLPRNTFDSVIMFGNNFGIVRTPTNARRLLRILHRITTPHARLFAMSLDVRETSNPDHLAYHRWNRARGRLPGQIRMRVRWGVRVNPWFDWLMVSPAEMRGLLRGTGWRLARVLSSRGPQYVGVVERVA